MEEGMKISTKNELTREQISSVIKKEFKSSEVTYIKQFKEGTLNTVYLIKGTNELQDGVVLKTAPNAKNTLPILEKDGLYTEVYVYQLLQDYNIPVPRMYAYDFSRKLIPCDYILLECIKGKSWSNYFSSYLLLNKSRPKLMEKLGKINAKLHGIEGKWFGYIKDDHCYRFNSWSEAFTAMVNNLLEDAKMHGYRIPYKEILSATVQRKALLDEIQTPKLVNYDMWTGNIYLAPKKEKLAISGIIDFERFFFGDPLATFPSFMLEKLEKDPNFIAGYRKVTNEHFVFSQEDKERILLYEIYTHLVEIACTYRYPRIIAEAYRYYLTSRIKTYLKKLSKTSMMSNKVGFKKLN
jgi:aminoglycoside phosphotransferase (APT) family kinase protein